MKERPLYYKPDGTPYEGIKAVFEWAKDFEVWENKMIRDTELWWGGRVSTVWLGMDHAFTMEGPPLIYETMVFRPNSFSELDMDRYSTREQAIAGHARVLRRWRWRFWYRWNWVGR